MIRDYFTYVWMHLHRRGLRSWLTLIGIFIGMAAVVSLISLSQGMQSAIIQQYEKVGADRIIIQPGGALAGPFSSALTQDKLTQKDLDAVRRVRGVRFAAPMIAHIATMEFKGEFSEAFIMGTPTDSETILNMRQVGMLELSEGRVFRPESKYEAIIGNNVASRFSKRNITTQDNILIAGKSFSVVGVLAKKGGVGFEDRVVRIPLSTAKELFGLGDEYSMIVVRVLPSASPDEVAESIRHELRQVRNVKAGEENFSVETSGEVIKSFLRILSIIQVLLIGVASVSLLVGGVGIMNTMFTAVVERTREIGVMKAVGARRRDILSIFLIESGFLGMVGGAIGVLLGLFISKSVELVAEQQLGPGILKAAMSPVLIIGVLLFAFGLGAISGYLPARRAAAMQPVEALRH